MVEFDDSRLELLERQLADKVIKRVRPALFGLYAAVGSAVIGVLTYVGVDIVTDIKSEVKTEIIKEIDKETKDKRAEIEEQVLKVKFLADQADETIEKVKQQLEAFRPQARELDETVSKLEEVDRRVRELNVTSQDLRADYLRELQPLFATIEALGRQLKTLSEQVEEINSIAQPGETGATTEPAQTFQARDNAIQSVTENTQTALSTLASDRKKITVFFQFAGGSRELAQSLSDALRAKNYIVPGEDREKGAVGKHEVRYFHEQDRVAADRLAEDTASALRLLVSNAESVAAIDPESFVSYSGKKPSAGVLELWLQIP